MELLDLLTPFHLKSNPQLNKIISTIWLLLTYHYSQSIAK